MAWFGDDALGLEAFSAWGDAAREQPRRASSAVRASYQPSANFRGPVNQEPLHVARRANREDLQEDAYARYEGVSGASGVVNRRGMGRRPQAGNSGTRELVRRACVTLGRTEAEADLWADRLEAEWLEDESQLRALSDDDWARLQVPSGLRTELRRCLRGNAPPQRYTPQRPSSAPPGRAAPSAGRAAPSRMASRAAGGVPSQRQHGSELEPVRKNLRQHVGASWSGALLHALRSRRDIDVDFLQGAFRSLGVPGVSMQQLRAVVRAAAPDGGRPSAESVIGVLHGPLRGRRAQAVRAVFDALDAGGEGLVPVSLLRRRCVAVEHPSVKASRLSASEALQRILRPWRQTPEITAEDFLAGHGPLSGVWNGDDEGFAKLVCRLWGVPLNSIVASRSGVKQQPVTNPMSQDRALVADNLWLEQPARQPEPRRKGAIGKSAHFVANARPRPTAYNQIIADDEMDDWVQRGQRIGANNVAEPLSRPIARPQAAFADGFWPEQDPVEERGYARQGAGVDFRDQVPSVLQVQDEVWEEEDQQRYVQPDSVSGGFWAEEDQQRQRVQAPLMQSPHAQALLERLRSALQRLGGNVWLDLSQRLRIAGRGQGGRVTPLELGAAIRQIGVGIPHGDAVALAYASDLDGSGCANIEKLLGFLAVPLSSQRAAVVRDVFRRLDEDKDGLLSIQQMLDRFVPGRHPDVESGRKNGREVLLEMQASLSNLGSGGRLSAPDFIRYYEGISAGISSDQYFAHIAQSVWGIDSGPNGLRARNSRRQQGSLRIFEAGLG